MPAITLNLKSVCAGGGHAVVEVTVNGWTRDLHVGVDDPVPDKQEALEALGVLVRHWLSKKATRKAKRDLLTGATVSISSPTGGVE